jgi:inosine/xanthosine triphosphatase
VDYAATKKRYLTPYLHNGMELGQAGDQFWSTKDIKHGNGVIAELTNGQVTRADYYSQAGLIALGQLVHNDWYLR